MIALLAARPACAEFNSVELSTARMAIDVCAAGVGTDMSKMRTLVAAQPELELHPAEKLPSAKGPETVTKLLHLAPDASVHRITFRKPPLDPVVFGAFPADLKACLVTVAGASEVGRAVRERVDAADSGWARIFSPVAQQFLWQRSVDSGPLQTLSLVVTSGSTVISVDTEFEVLPTLSRNSTTLPTRWSRRVRVSCCRARNSLPTCLARCSSSQPKRDRKASP